MQLAMLCKVTQVAGGVMHAGWHLLPGKTNELVKPKGGISF